MSLRPAMLPAGVLIVVASLSPAAQRAERGDRSLFSSADPLELTLQAPLQQLFESGLDNEEYVVPGTLTVQPAPPFTSIVVRDVEVSVRGNTSKRESECPFPKLKLKGKDSKGAKDSKELDTIKIGTHCGEQPGDALTKRFGRLANEKSAWREALTYRLVDAVGMPTLRVRPARVTYIDTTPGRSASSGPLQRNAVLVEDDDDAKKRLEAEDEIPMEKFGSARQRFSDADAARLAFAEAMIGNFDWCVKFSPDDAYRCDQRRPLWNVLALRRGSRAFPLIKDFDLAGTVTGRHRWFADVYNPAFVASKSPIDTEVVSQVQRTRTLFSREVLDRARQDLLDRRRAVEDAIASAPVDADGRELARQYVASFFEAISSDAAFYRPVVVTPGVRLYKDAQKTTEACAPGDTVPVGTPVNERQRAESMTEVVLLDALWHWAPPHQCEAVRRGTVWIDAAAIGTEYPSQIKR